MEPQIFCGHDLDFWGSRDVVGHVTVGLATRDITRLGGGLGPLNDAAAPLSADGIP